MNKVLHIASWYPSPVDGIAGNFIQDQIRIFSKEICSETIVMRTIYHKSFFPLMKSKFLTDGVREYSLFIRFSQGRMFYLACTMHLVAVLLYERAWRFRALHFHIAIPLLLYVRWWKRLFRVPILVSEHWTAYHYGFYLDPGSRAYFRLGEPFRHGFPVFAVSNALIEDIKRFAGPRTEFPSFVIPNFVPLHGYCKRSNVVPVLFTVNIWRKMKNPFPMLRGLDELRRHGIDFHLVIGGYGEELEAMQHFVADSNLHDCTEFLGKMSKKQIAQQLSVSNVYLFSSDYETFSVACAEALGAGVPLLGPFIPAIAEYAGPKEWIVVEARAQDAWLTALKQAVAVWLDEGWENDAIAERAALKFSEDSLQLRYRKAMQTLGLL